MKTPGQLLRTAHTKLQVGDKVLVEVLPGSAWYDSLPANKFVIGTIKAKNIYHNMQAKSAKALPNHILLNVGFIHPTSGLDLGFSITICRTKELLSKIHPFWANFVVHGAVV